MNSILFPVMVLIMGFWVWIGNVYFLFGDQIQDLAILMDLGCNY
jgi:hypothetical protein